MGNRAYVIFHDERNNEISAAVYLHWNGGPESIYAFLDELERRGVRNDAQYAPARFCHVVGDFFDQSKAGGDSLGVSNGPAEISTEALDAFAKVGDNGAYVVSYPDGKRKVRRFMSEGWNGPTVELSAKDVEKERKVAYKHAYHVGDKKRPDLPTIPTLFARLRPFVDGKPEPELPLHVKLARAVLAEPDRPDAWQGLVDCLLEQHLASK